MGIRHDQLVRRTSAARAAFVVPGLIPGTSLALTLAGLPGGTGWSRQGPARRSGR